jgi:hypothetical protein
MPLKLDTLRDKQKLIFISVIKFSEKIILEKLNNSLKGRALHEGNLLPGKVDITKMSLFLA